LFKDHYCWVPGFQLNDDDNFETDPSLESFNAQKRMLDLVNYITLHVEPYHRTNHVALPWGCDFAYQNAAQNYEEMEKLIDYVNTRNQVNVVFLQSTPGRYVDALKATATTFPVYYNDMYPYSDAPNEYWSGYFSSRPSGKISVKHGSAFL